MMSFPALLICRPLAYMLMQMKPADREIIQGVTVQKDKSLPGSTEFYAVVLQ